MNATFEISAEDEACLVRRFETIEKGVAWLEAQFRTHLKQISDACLAEDKTATGVDPNTLTLTELQSVKQARVSAEAQK